MEAEALFGYDDSLVVANLRIGVCQSHLNLGVEASGAERISLVRRAWNVLLSIIPLLLRRAEANTLLPGTVREEELDYYAHVQAALMKAQNKPVPPPAVLRAVVTLIGYSTLLDAIFMSLKCLGPMSPQQVASWPATQERMVESFVLQGLDVVSRTAGIPAAAVNANEGRLVAIFEEYMNPRNYEPAFCAAVLRKRRSNAVSSVLRARGVLLTGNTTAAQSRAEFDVQKRADVAKHGLRDCALPSCSKTEKTVKEFAGCTGCRSVVYCCLEHHALDWRAHKKACREKEAARLAAEEEAEEDTGAGAAAA